MKHDIEENRRFLQFHKGLEKNEVSRAADGQELCETLNDPQKDGLKKINMKSPSFCRLEIRNSDFACLPVGRCFEFKVSLLLILIQQT
jgi:hypothetical protein